MTSTYTPSPRAVQRGVAMVVLAGLLLAVPGTTAPPAEAETPALAVPYQLVVDRDVHDRLPSPEDRYALAGGCYTMQADDGTWVARDDAMIVDGAEGDAVPFHFQPTRLGEYLIAANEGPDTSVEGAWWDVRSYLSQLGVGTSAQPGLPGVTVSVQPILADAPSAAAEWTITAVGDDPDARDEHGQAYEVASPDGIALGTYTFHHVADDDPTDDDPNGTACADWPEVDTNTEGRPDANPAGPAAEVRGFFESHVHGMAFEFLGGEARCGRPWHPYGVEYALVDCEDHAAGGRGAVLEVAVSGGDPVNGHDTVGWPTFGYWPAHDSLTHEQYYWRWLERAYLGGLRLSVNLFVDNTALCEIYPVKRNSCNEMDGVRLQAQRLFELQDYIDAQSGGPGEGWLRIVTDPTQAREVINAGRLAVVMGIEVSELFDCSEFLDQPNCTAEQIDQRLEEVHDMGIRQMELVNKFDNALSGVTGDGGATGVLVNWLGQRWTSGHYWDMQTCAPTEAGHSHEHDKTQVNVADDLPDGGHDEVDVLAGAILEQFAPTRGYAAPAYPAGPHCNTRGLTPLGEHLITEMVARGMVVDPDHMSAAAQRAALDLIQDVIIPAEHERAHAEGRAPIQPSLISSHSWGNDEIYQRIYVLDGVIGSRTASADRFVDYWAQRRGWAATLAPADSLFGLGYGADTNGLGGQPGPRSNPAVPLDYEGGIDAPIGGVTLHQQTSGVRTYDVSVDGVAHYGLFADWFAELALAADEARPDLGGGQAIIDDMLNGAEAYLRMWERATYGSNDCVTDGSHLQAEDLHALVGGNLEAFLSAVGQPMDRDGAAYTYCATDDVGHPVQARVTFAADGRVAAVDATPVWDLPRE